MKRILLIAIVLTAAAHSSVNAQAELDEFWQQLSAARSVEAVSQVPRPTEDRTAAEIADGLLTLREFELTYKRSTALVAQRALEKTVNRAPANAWAHYAYGMSLARGPDMRLRPFAERDVYVVFSKGTLAALRAPRELRRALELDPELPGAAMEFANFALDMNDRELLQEAAGYVSRGAVAQTKQGLMMRAKLLQRLGSLADAHAVLGQAQSAGVDASVAAHERAETEFRMGRSDLGTVSYLKGASALTDEGADAYFASLNLLLSPQDEAEWMKLDNAARGPWLRRFWDTRAALAGVTLQERLAEHFRRTKALENYRLPKTTAGALGSVVAEKRNPSVAETAPTILNIIRHGQWDRSGRFMYCKPGWEKLPVAMQPTASECAGTPYGRRLNKNHGDCPNPPAEERQHNSSARYNQMLCFLYLLPDMADVAGRNGAMLTAQAEAVTGETFYPTYATHFAMAWEAYAFRTPGRTGSTDIYAAATVPGESITRAVNGGVLNGRITLTLTDTLQDWIQRGSSTFGGPTAGIANDALFLAHAGVEAPAARAVALRIRVEAEGANAGSIAYGEIDIPAYPADSLSMSDVVLSPADGRGTFTRGDVRLSLAPGRMFRADESPVLYYELYGTTAGTSVVTDVSVTEVNEKGMATAPSMSLTFTDPPRAEHPQYGLQVSRELALGQLKSGVYRLRITATETATRRTTHQDRLVMIE